MGTMMLFPQIIMAMLVGIFYYMMIFSITVYDGALSLIFQPIVGAFLSGLAILILLVVGLPIRLIEKWNFWWKAHWWVPPALATLACLMMCISWLPSLRVQVPHPDYPIMTDYPQPILSQGGWLLTLFAVLHFYPPSAWFEKR